MFTEPEEKQQRIQALNHSTFSNISSYSVQREEYIRSIIGAKTQSNSTSFNDFSRERFLKEPVLIWNRAKLLGTIGLLEAKIAAFEFERALGLDPELNEEPMFLWEWGVVCLGYGNAKDAYDKFKMAEALEPTLWENAQFIWDKSSALLNLNDTYAALLGFKKALQKNEGFSRNAEFLWGVAIALLNGGNYYASQRVLDFALHLDGSLANKAFFVWDQALLLLGINKPIQAFVKFSRALELEKSLERDPIFVWQRAVALMRINGIKKAELEFQRALILKEDLKHNSDFMQNYYHFLQLTLKVPEKLAVDPPDASHSNGPLQLAEQSTGSVSSPDDPVSGNSDPHNPPQYEDQEREILTRERETIQTDLPLEAQPSKATSSENGILLLFDVAIKNAAKSFKESSYQSAFTPDKPNKSRK